MKWRNFVRDYLVFTRKDRIGIICLFLLILIAYLLPKLFSNTPATVSLKENPELAAALDTIQQKSNSGSGNDDDKFAYQFERSEDKNFTTGELFAFDPNTLPSEGWQRLGLNDRTIKTINNYRSKGGKFYKPEDIKKIWGMPEGFYERVKNYIAIASTEKNFPQHNYEKGVYEKTERKIGVININVADTSAFISLPGIGRTYANRIVNFRNKLGGFHSLEQIKETYGLPDSTFQKIKPYLTIDAAAIKKFNLNAVTKDELKLHPYIKWNLANAIVEYRVQHGAFANINDLKKIALVDDETFRKIAPYFFIP